MYKVTVEVSFDAAHRLLDYSGKCFRNHGHSYTALVELISSKLYGSGFVVDFGDVKKLIKNFVDTHWDHSTLLNAADLLVPLLSEQGCSVYVMEGDPTAERMAEVLYKYIQDNLTFEGDVRLKSVTIKETPITASTYYEED